MLLQMQDSIPQDEYIRYMQLLQALRDPLRSDHLQAIQFMTEWQAAMDTHSQSHRLIDLSDPSSLLLLTLLYIFANRGR
jgi:hypothetical protein